jgi:hypothetical protein
MCGKRVKYVQSVDENHNHQHHHLPGGRKIGLRATRDSSLEGERWTINPRRRRPAVF